MVPTLLLALPFAFVVERALRRLVWVDEIADESAGRKLLAWQVEPYASRLRIVTAACVPFLAAAAALRFEGLAAAVAIMVLTAFLICAATDLLCYRVPEIITYPGTVLAIAAAAALPGGDAQDAALGGLIAAGLFLPQTLLTQGRRFGLADANFAIFVGASLGLSRGFQALCLGVIAGGLVLLVLLLLGAVSRHQVTCYAPFLAGAAIGIALFRGMAFAPS